MWTSALAGSSQAQKGLSQALSSPQKAKDGYRPSLLCGHRRRGFVMEQLAGELRAFQLRAKASVSDSRETMGPQKSSWGFPIELPTQVAEGTRVGLRHHDGYVVAASACSTAPEPLM